MYNILINKNTFILKILKMSDSKILKLNIYNKLV